MRVCSSRGDLYYCYLYRHPARTLRILPSLDNTLCASSSLSSAAPASFILVVIADDISRSAWQ